MAWGRAQDVELYAWAWISTWEGGVSPIIMPTFTCGAHSKGWSSMPGCGAPPPVILWNRQNFIILLLAGSFLAPFASLDEYQVFYNGVLNSPAMQKYCFHGGRFMQWLPYLGWDDITGEVNLTYYESNDPLDMNQAWRKNNPKSNERPYCVIARMGV